MWYFITFLMGVIGTILITSQLHKTEKNKNIIGLRTQLKENRIQLNLLTKRIKEVADEEVDTTIADILLDLNE